MKTTNLMLTMAFALSLAAAPSRAAEPKADLDLKDLQRMEEQARGAGDFRELARLYELRAEMLEEKVERHRRLEQRFASAPKSLIAKRGTAWNTPKRQRQMAEKAASQAEEARRMADAHLAKADSLAVDVD